MTLGNSGSVAISADDLCRDLRALGLDAGAALVVHVALRQIGWVAGRAASIIHALMAVLTPAGTLVMPTFSERLCDPAEWYDPPAPAGQVAIIRAEMQPFDPVRTPTQNMARSLRPSAPVPVSTAATTRCNRSRPGVVEPRN